MALTSKVLRRRRQAHKRQRELCCYCEAATWERDMHAFRKRFGLTKREAELRKSTAEHLIARKDGGTDDASNVASACTVCNARRHQRKNKDLTAQQYRELVQGRMQAGGWHPRSLLTKMRVVEILEAAVVAAPRNDAAPIPAPKRRVGLKPLLDTAPW